MKSIIVTVKKLRGRQTPDIVYLQTVRAAGGWMSAREVASVHVHSWWMVAHALRRLGELGLLEENVIDVIGLKRMEHSRVYRARPTPGAARRIDTGLPAWLCPDTVADVGAMRRVEGKAGIRRWELDPKQDETEMELA